MPFVKGPGKFLISTPQYCELKKTSIDSLLCADCVFEEHGRASQEQGNRLKSLSAARVPPLAFQLASVG